MWRTAPLWGIGCTEKVMGSQDEKADPSGHARLIDSAFS